MAKHKKKKKKAKALEIKKTEPVVVKAKKGCQRKKEKKDGRQAKRNKNKEEID